MSTQTRQMDRKNGVKTSETLKFIPINLIDEGENVRSDYSDIKQFAELFCRPDVKPEEQQEQAGAVYRGENGRFVVIDGLRRFRAIKYANEKLGMKISGYWATVKSKPAEDQLIVDQCIYNTGKSLTPIEYASAWRKLINEHDYDAKMIAEKFKVSLPTVYNYLHFCEASIKIRKAIHNGILSPTAAIEIIKDAKSQCKDKKDLKEQFEIQENILEKAMKKQGVTVGKNPPALRIKTTSVQKVKYMISAKKIKTSYESLNERIENVVDPVEKEKLTVIQMVLNKILNDEPLDDLIGVENTQVMQKVA